jgi:type IV secretory pathway TraG/TraD family ATPase VirD4
MAAPRQPQQNQPPWLLLGLILAVVLVVHLAFLCAGTGVGVLRLDQTLQAAVMTMTGNEPGFTRRGLTPPDPKVLGIWLGFWAVVVAVTLGGSFILWDRRKSARSAELSTGEELRKRVTGHGVAAVVPFAHLDGKPVTIREEDTSCTIAPPRAGKSAYLAIGRIVDAAGAVVATSTKADVFRVTVKKRSDLGHVFVFDFDGITRWPGKARWDMVAGCENPDAAQSRAAAIVNARPAGSAGMKDSAHFVEGVKIILRSLLHAAALIPSGNMRDVVRWAQDFTDHEPSAILRDLSPNGAIWARELDQWCREDAPETIGNTKTTLSRITASLTDARVLALLCPAPPTEDGDAVVSFRARDFVLSTDTVYCLVDDSRESSTAPIITALVSAIIEEAKTVSQHTTSGRLPTAMTLVLDEVANVSPLPQLPNLMSDGGGRGLHTWIFAQSMSQLVGKWGPEAATTIFESSAAKIIFGGLADETFLEKISRLIGTHQVTQTSKSLQRNGAGRDTSSTSTSEREERRMKVEDIRKIPEGNALLLYREKEAIVQLTPWWKRLDADQLHQSQEWSLALEGITA